MTKLCASAYYLRFPTLPPEFDGFTVAHVSDLHNQDHKGALIERIDLAKPDIVVVTGDSIHNENETEHACRFFEQACARYPVYYVTGNHESVLTCYPQFLAKILSYGTVPLFNESTHIARGTSYITLAGIEDPTFFPIAEGYETDEKERGKYKSDRVTKAEKRPAGKGRKQSFYNKLDEMGKQLADEPFTILLSHRPEVKDKYFDAGFDLTLTGHAHGGQFIFPFLGPIYAPNQGLFPKLTCGVHERGTQKMVISRGLGDSHRTKRFRNPYELVTVTLTR